MEWLEGAYYALPPHLTWAGVAEARKRWDIDPRFAPLGTGPGCVLWGRLVPSSYRVFFADFREDAPHG